MKKLILIIAAVAIIGVGATIGNKGGNTAEPPVGGASAYTTTM